MSDALAISRRALQRVQVLVLTIAVGSLLVACAGPSIDTPPPSASAPTARVAGEPKWWRLRVRMGFKDLEQVQWHIDALLAERLFAPLIERYGPALTPWRFHRRAGPDEYGHQFSFIFYADAAIADRVVRTLDASLLLDRLRRAGYVRSVLMPHEDTVWGGDLGAVSDRSWPTEIQRSWPWFIMGVSQHWLALIREVRSGADLPADGDLHATLARYEAIHSRVDALWQNHAQHAYLHHLNAAFGYRLLLLEERRLTRF